jgi:hypothetical protein
VTAGAPAVIRLPWRAVPDYQCFGCSPANEHGLRMEFTPTADGIESLLRFDRTFESYPGVVHGGLSTTACDEIMGNLLVIRTGFAVFTTSLRTRYVSPLSVGTTYRCVATTEVTAGDDGPYQAQAQILDPAGDPLVFATASYQPVTAEQARARMDLSDQQADLIEQELSQLRKPATNGKAGNG